MFCRSCERCGSDGSEKPHVMVRFRRMEKVHAYVGSTCYSPPDCRHHCRSRVRSHEEWVIARTFNLRASRCRKGRGVVHHPSLSLFPVRHRHPRLQTWQAPLFHALSSVSSVSFPPTHPAGSVRLPTVPRTALPPSPLSLSSSSFRCLPFSCRVTPSRHASPHRSDLERKRQPVSTNGERRSTSSLALP